jgi:hypothetical protein
MKVAATSQRQLGGELREGKKEKGPSSLFVEVLIALFTHYRPP